MVVQNGGSVMPITKARHDTSPTLTTLYTIIQMQLDYRIWTYFVTEHGKKVPNWVTDKNITK